MDSAKEVIHKTVVDFIMELPPMDAHMSRVTIIGAGTIGVSLAALHVIHMYSASQLTIMDTRPELRAYIESTLPLYLPTSLTHLVQNINISSSLPEAVTRMWTRKFGFQETALGKC